MKDFTIDVVATGAGRNSIAMGQSKGTLSERPTVRKTLRDTALPDAAFTTMLDCLDDLQGYLGENDTVTVQLHCAGDTISDWISMGPKSPELKSRIRDRSIALAKDGISLTLAAAQKPDPRLADLISMSASLRL